MARTSMEPKRFLKSRRAFLDGLSSPRAFLESCLERIEALEPVVKAFKYLDAETARRRADEAGARYRSGRPLSPLDGCPVGIKDIIETKNMPTGFGSPAFEGTMAHRDAACVEALRQGGVIILGKTVTTEFAFGFSGPTTNPHDSTRTPGGSSSGSAAAVGAGMLPIALGTQTIGSVLRPASYNGVYGYKGTFGSLPMGGIHPVSVSHDQLGVFANGVDDLWATASWISSSIGSPGYPSLRGAAEQAPPVQMPHRLIRLYTKGWEELEPEHQEVFESTLRQLAGAGVEIVDRDSDPRVREFELLLARDSESATDIIAYEIRWPYSGYVERFGDVIGRRIREVLERSKAITSADYEALMLRRQAARSATTQVLTAVGADAFIMPSSSGPAPSGLEFTGSRTFLLPWSWLGFPAISVPVMEADRMPWGLQVMHVADGDAKLCAIARWIGESVT